MIAQQLHIAFIPIRKAGKLPGEKFKTTYKLEYGEVRFNINFRESDIWQILSSFCDLILFMILVF